MEIQKKYFNDLKNIIEEKSKYNKKLVLLSGGIDSLLLLTLAVELFGKNKVCALTVNSKDTKDNLFAKKFAEYFNIKHIEKKYDFNYICQKIVLLPKKLNVWHTFYYFYIKEALLEEKYSKYDIFWGEGADGLYGSTMYFIYLGLKDLVKEGKSEEEAKIILKKKFYNSNISANLTFLFKELIEPKNNFIMPYKDERLKYILDIPNTDDKNFVKEGLKNVYSLPEDIVNVKRIYMQRGLGVYNEIKEFKKTFKKGNYVYKLF